MGQFTRSKRYAAYINSSAWQTKRKLKLAATGYCCEKCGFRSLKGLHVHHLHYRSFGREQLADIQVLCEPCHNLIHHRPQPKPAKPAQKATPSKKALRKRECETKRLLGPSRPARQRSAKSKRVAAENDVLHSVLERNRLRRELRRSM